MEIKSTFSLKPPVDSPEERERQERQLRTAAEMYEQHFLREMVRNMRQSVPEGGLVETNFAEKIFREQLDNQYVDSWSKRGGVGFADMIFEHVKERYLNPGDKTPPPAGPLPLERGMKVHPLNSDSPDKSRFLFEGTEGMDQSQLEVRSPWPGLVQESFSDGQGHAKISIVHDNGLKSLLLIEGDAELGLAGRQVAAGQKLGVLDAEKPRAQWQIGRT